MPGKQDQEAESDTHHSSVITHHSGGCPVCGADGNEIFFEAHKVPVFCNVLWPDREAALGARRAEISLALCRGCGLIYNAAFDPHLVEYDPAYENSLHFSPRFQQYADCLAKRLVERHGLQGKDVIEIGCGQGDFLALLAQHGAGRCVGFDPSFDPARAAAAPGVTVVAEYFGEGQKEGRGDSGTRGLGDGETAQTGGRNSEFGVRNSALSIQHSALSADLICCRHVLEHVADPIGFLQCVRHAADPSAAPVASPCPRVPASPSPRVPESPSPRVPASPSLPVFFFEVPNALCTLKDLAVWDIIYEHCCYYTRASLAEVFRRAGFQALSLAEEYEGQFLTIEARTGEGAAAGSPASLDADGGEVDTAALCRQFRAAYERKLGTWRAMLQLLAGQGKRVVLWGAGSKGVTFLNVLNVPTRVVEYVVDINPRKAGRFIPGTGQQVVEPDFLREYQPNVIIVMNPIYVDEISRQIGGLIMFCDVMTA